MNFLTSVMGIRAIVNYDSTSSLLPAVEKQIDAIASSSYVTEMLIHDIAELLKKIPDKKQKNRLLASKIVELEFSIKQKNESYALVTDVARKTYAVSHGIIASVTKDGVIESASDTDVLAHPQDCYFLVNSPHYFHKHIEIIRRVWKVDARVIHRNGSLDFFDGQHVSDLREAWEKNNEMRYELNCFGVHEQDDIVLQPSFITDNSERKYYIEVVVDTPRTDCRAPGNAYHTFMRLIDSAGHVISVGKFFVGLTPHNAGSTVHVSFSSSDRHEWLNKGTLRARRIEITEEEYYTLLDDVKNDIEHRSSKYFNIFKKNCSEWVLEKLKRFDIVDVDSEKMKVLWCRIFVPPPINGRMEGLKKYRIRILRAVYTFFHWSAIAFDYINVLGRLLVVFRDASQKNCNAEDARALINNLNEFITGKRIFCLHPFLVYRYAQEFPLQSRKAAAAASNAFSLSVG